MDNSHLYETNHTPEENRAALLAGWWTYTAKVWPDRLDELALDGVPATTPVQITHLFTEFPPELVLAGVMGALGFQASKPQGTMISYDQILYHLPARHRRVLGITSYRVADLWKLILGVGEVLRDARSLFDQLRRMLLAGESIDATRVRAIVDEQNVTRKSSMTVGDQTSLKEIVSPDERIMTPFDR
jgi:hypothetical protein